MRALGRVLRAEAEPGEKVTESPALKIALPACDSRCLNDQAERGLARKILDGLEKFFSNNVPPSTSLLDESMALRHS